MRTWPVIGALLLGSCASPVLLVDTPVSSPEVNEFDRCRREVERAGRSWAEAHGYLFRPRDPTSHYFGFRLRPEGDDARPIMVVRYDDRYKKKIGLFRRLRIPNLSVECFNCSDDSNPPGFTDLRRKLDAAAHCVRR